MSEAGSAESGSILIRRNPIPDPAVTRAECVPPSPNSLDTGCGIPESPRSTGGPHVEQSLCAVVCRDRSGSPAVTMTRPTPGGSPLVGVRSTDALARTLRRSGEGGRARTRRGRAEVPPSSVEAALPVVGWREVTRKRPGFDLSADCGGGLRRASPDQRAAERQPSPLKTSLRLRPLHVSVAR